MYCYDCGEKTAEDDSGYCSCSKHGILWKLYRNAPCADALVLADGQILLVKRGREPFKDMWAMPGGFQEFGEHPSATVKRELEEETGLKIQLDGVMGIYVQRIKPQEFRQVTVFLANVLSGILAPGDDADECR